MACATMITVWHAITKRMTEPTKCQKLEKTNLRISMSIAPKEQKLPN